MLIRYKAMGDSNNNNKCSRNFDEKSHRSGIFMGKIYCDTRVR